MTGGCKSFDVVEEHVDQKTQTNNVDIENTFARRMLPRGSNHQCVAESLDHHQTKTGKSHIASKFLVQMRPSAPGREPLHLRETNRAGSQHRFRVLLVCAVQDQL